MGYPAEQGNQNVHRGNASRVFQASFLIRHFYRGHALRLKAPSSPVVENLERRREKSPSFRCQPRVRLILQALNPPRPAQWRPRRSDARLVDHIRLTLLTRVTKMCDRVTRMWDPPPIIYRKNNFGGRARGGGHQIQILITFLFINTISNILPTPSFRAESWRVVQIAVKGL